MPDRPARGSRSRQQEFTSAPEEQVPGASSRAGQPEGASFSDWNPDDSVAPTAASQSYNLQMKWRGSDLPDELLAALEKVEDEIVGPASNIQALSANASLDPMAPVGLENIVGYGIMEKQVGREYTGVLGITFLVRKKLPESRILPSAAIPSEIPIGRMRPEIRTDVIEVGDIQPQQRVRPAPCGSSVGHPGVTFGTLGAVVVLNASPPQDHLCILSNCHVLANSGVARSVANDGVQNADPILQPGPAHGGTHPADRIAILDRFVRLKFGGEQNRVDAALGWTKRDLVDPRFGRGAFAFKINPDPILTPGIGMEVRKVGATTGHTLGRIKGIVEMPQVPYRATIGGAVVEVGRATFTQQLSIEGIGGLFSQGGDSGSLIVEADSLRPVALLFAGDQPGRGILTYANPIGAVLAELHSGGFRFLSEFPPG